MVCTRLMHKKNTIAKTVIKEIIIVIIIIIISFLYFGTVFLSG